MRRIAVLSLLAVLAWPAAVRAEEEEHEGKPVDLPAGTAKLAEAELHAEDVNQQIRVEVDLDRDPGGAALRLTLPSDVDVAGGAPRLEDSAGGRVDLADDGRTVTLDLDRARVGDQAEMAITDRGIPAGSYELPLHWVSADGSSSPAGELRLRIHAGEREKRAPDWNRVQRLDINASNDANEESETFIAGRPNDAGRLLAAANKGAPPGGGASDLSGGFFVSGDGGRTWAERHVSTQLAVPGGGGVQASTLSGDPILAADDLGNLWAGGLTVCRNTTVVSRIFVDRMPAGSTSFASPGVGLPILHGAGICNGDTVQDKPQMTIDNYESSPTYGRLYVTWDDPDPGGGVNVVISSCDTRPGGVANAANCDDPDQWSAPVRVSGPDDGSFITSDPAVGPDGRVYVAWWDYSSASLPGGNAIKLVSCPAASANCRTSGGFSAPAVLAQLDGPEIVPFACPIVAQPGGRVGPVPSLAVGPDGRIYAAWSDLRDGSGTTRCTQSSISTSEETWDSFVATAPDVGTLLAASDRASASVGARVISDTGAGSDEWFPWVAVDRASGLAYVDFYSTSGDATRRTAQFYIRGVGPGSGTQASLGPLQQISTGPSDYSGNPCCNFGNDYGDYTGLTVAEGTAYPIWTQRAGLGDDGEIRVGIPGPSLAVDSVGVVEAPGSDGDGVVESGEPFRLDVRLINEGAGNAANLQGTVSAPGGEATFDSASMSFGDAARRGGRSNTASATGRFGSACGSQATFTLAVTADDATQSLPISVPVACQQAPASSAFQPVLPELPAPTATTARSPGGKATVVQQRLGTVLKRGLAARVSCARTCTMRLSVLLPPAKGKRGPTVTLATRTVKNLRSARTVHIKLGPKSRRRLRSSGRKRLQLQFVATAPSGGRQARSVTVVLI